MTLPVMPVRLPACLADQQNGKLDPAILVPTPGLAGGPTVRLVEPATRAWRALTAAASAAGHTLKATSAADSYRTYAQQVAVFTDRYQVEPIPDRPFRLWDSDNSGTPEKWWQKPNTAPAAVPGTCIEAEALVLARRGLVPIAEIVVGDEVWTHEYRWRAVTEVRSFLRPVVRLAGSGHPGIDVTREHRWWVFDGWHRARTVRKGIVYAGTDLRVRSTVDAVGDLWASPEYVSGVEAPACATPEWVRWAGVWVADGSLHYVNGMLTEGLLYPRDSKAEQVTRWASAAGVALSENTDRGDGTRRFRFGRAEARRLEEHFGRLSTQRTIPIWLLANAQKYAEPFLAGYLHGDGYRTHREDKTDHWSFSVSSRRLAVGLRLLAQSAGWHAYLSSRAWAVPSTVKGRACVPTAETWTVVLYEAKPPIGTRLWNHQGYTVGRIRRLTDRDQICRVFDLTVAEDESFCVDGIFTHNSNHGLGLAVDTGEERDGDTGTESMDQATLDWLVAHELAFGFSHELQVEPWHIRYWAGDTIPAAVLAYEASQRGADDMGAFVLRDFPNQPLATQGAYHIADASPDGYHLAPRENFNQIAWPGAPVLSPANVPAKYDYLAMLRILFGAPRQDGGGTAPSGPVDLSEASYAVIRTIVDEELDEAFRAGADTDQ